MCRSWKAEMSFVFSGWLGCAFVDWSLEQSVDSSSVCSASFFHGRIEYSPVSQIRRDPVA